MGPIPQDSIIPPGTSEWVTAGVGCLLIVTASVVFKRKRIEKAQNFIANHPSKRDHEEIKYLAWVLREAHSNAGAFLWRIRNRREWKSDYYFLGELSDRLEKELVFFHLLPEEEERLLMLLKRL